MYAKAIAFATALSLLFIMARHGYAADEPPSALPPHCIGSGPTNLPITTTDPTFCGCTWGVVYYRGQPVPGARVGLHFDEKTFVADTRYHHEFPDYPYYVASGLALSAERGDVLTFTVDFAGASLVRPFRAWPATTGESQGEQEVPLVLPEVGIWQPMLNGGYTRTLSLQGETLWAGGPVGLTKVNLATGQATSQPLPWSPPTIVALASAANQGFWAAGPHHLAALMNEQWQAVATPFTATIRALAVDPRQGDLWVGGGDHNGALARYDSQQWHTITAIVEPITTLAIDQQGGIWVGTWDGGVYYQAGEAAPATDTWQVYDTADGLASNLVRTAAVGPTSVWFGTEPYLDTDGYHGGLSRYDLRDSSWHTYTLTHGLPAASNLPSAPTAITALAVDKGELAWAGTAQSVQIQATTRRWLTDTITTAPISALAVTADWVVAAQADGLILALDRRVTPGQPPLAQFTPGASDRLTLSDTLRLHATATDQDEESTNAAAQILAWDWRSNLDGPLCTTADECSLPTHSLTPGVHTISLRVQDDEGVWSAPVTTKVTIAAQLFLPLAMQ